jgi:hypothetical protein
MPEDVVHKEGDAAVGGGSQTLLFCSQVWGAISGFPCVSNRL